MNRFPEQNFSVMVLCNATGSIVNQNGLANQVADIFLADQFKKVPVAVKETVAAADAPPIISIPEKELASLTGLYFDPLAEIYLRRFYMKDGKLMVELNLGKGDDFVLSPTLSRNRFKVVGVGAPLGFEMVFERTMAGGPMQVKSIVGGKTVRTRDAVRSVPSSIQLAEFTGKYVSDELPGATYTLSIKDGKLLLLIRNGTTVFSDRGLVLAFGQAIGSEAPKDILLTPVFADAFFTLGESIIMRFMRNQQNAISGFTLTADNSVIKLRFNKQ